MSSKDLLKKYDQWRTGHVQSLKNLYSRQEWTLVGPTKWYQLTGYPSQTELMERLSPTYRRYRLMQIKAWAPMGVRQSRICTTRSPTNTRSVGWSTTVRKREELYTGCIARRIYLLRTDGSSLDTFRATLWRGTGIFNSAHRSSLINRSHRIVSKGVPVVERDMHDYID